MDKYRIYCETHGWVEVISDFVPNTCPINGSDTVRGDSVCVIEPDVKVNDGTLTQLTLANYKQLRYNEIDKRTGELILQGYVYSSKTFSLSETAQTNILALDNTRDDPALTYPITYNTIDDLDTYSVVDSTDLHNMYLTALATKKSHLDSGTVLKQQVRDAVDKAAVDLVIDNR
jgi:hypothetical protein